MSACLAAAERFAARGIPVFPTARDKRPMTRRGLHDATTDIEALRAYWRRWPNANVAIRTGAPSGLVVLDVDGQEGADSLAELERQHGPLPLTTTVKTPRGGAHYYFRHPGEEIKNSAGTIAPGIDIRGDGGYVLAPPSIGLNGRRYEWDEQAPLAAAGALIAARRPATRPAARPAQEWVRMISSGPPEGQRNDSLARLCGHLLARGIDPRVTRAILLAVNDARCRPPLPEIEVARLVESITQRHLRDAA